jgi:hypothetical protein
MRLALLANAAPLLGLALWFTPFSFTGGGGWDFAKLFMIGIYMTFAGLVVPAIIWPLAAPGLARTEARAAVRFHGIIVGVLAAFCLIAIVDFMTAAFVLFAIGTFVLPLVELARVAIGLRRVLARRAASANFSSFIP